MKSLDFYQQLAKAFYVRVQSRNRHVSIVRRLTIELAADDADFVRQLNDTNLMEHVILRTLHKESIMTMGDLAKYESLKPPYLSIITNKLENNGYVVRFQKEDNRRITYVKLTEKGIDYTQKLQDIGIIPFMTTHQNALSGNEVRQIVAEIDYIIALWGIPTAETKENTATRDIPLDLDFYSNLREKHNQLANISNRITSPVFSQKHESEIKLTILENILLTEVMNLSLAENTSIRMQRIAEVLFIPRIGRIVDKLVKNGLLSRYKKSQNRKVLYIDLTDKGKAFLLENDQARIESIRNATMHLNDEQLHRLYEANITIAKLLQKINDIYEKSKML